MPKENDLNRLIMKFLHVNPYSRHPRYQKMLMGIKKFHYWPNLKKEVGDFIARCIEFYQVKVE